MPAWKPELADVQIYMEFYPDIVRIELKTASSCGEHRVFGSGALYDSVLQSRKSRSAREANGGVQLRHLAARLQAPLEQAWMDLPSHLPILYFSTFLSSSVRFRVLPSYLWVMVNLKTAADAAGKPLQLRPLGLVDDILPDVKRPSDLLPHELALRPELLQRYKFWRCLFPEEREEFGHVERAT